jgi:hypothetical protein
MTNFLDSIINLLAGLVSALLLALSSLFLGPTIVQPSAPTTATTQVTTTEPAPDEAHAATTTSPLPQTQKNTIPAPASTATAPQSTPPPAPVTKPVPTKSQEEVNTDTRAALVNIFCTTKYGGYLKPISGSGIIVDSRGIILTNAHVGQYFLLRDYYTPGNIDCIVRTGSPAAARYRAQLVYLPPAWVQDNAEQLISSAPTGTGENDYAFLRITGTTDPNGTLPTSFPAVAMTSSYPDVGDPMLLAAYPAGFLSAEFITKSLYASSAVTYTTRLYSFDDDTQKVDLFSIGGTILSQAGSSGGAVVRLNDGRLSGLIATATIADTTGQRDLRAETMSHIDHSLHTGGMGGINGLLIGDIAAKAADFNTKIAPGLTAQLEAVLGN